MAGMKNYAAMAQGAAMPEQQLTPEQTEQLKQMEANALTAEDYEAMGMPTGNSPEAVKERIMILLERYEVLEQLSATDKSAIMEDVDRLVQDLLAGNLEGVSQNPVGEMLGEASKLLPNPEEMELLEDGS